MHIFDISWFRHNTSQVSLDITLARRMKVSRIKKVTLNALVLFPYQKFVCWFSKPVRALFSMQFGMQSMREYDFWGIKNKFCHWQRSKIYRKKKCSNYLKKKKKFFEWQYLLDTHALIIWAHFSLNEVRNASNDQITSHLRRRMSHWSTRFFSFSSYYTS